MPIRRVIALGTVLMAWQTHEPHSKVMVRETLVPIFHNLNDQTVACQHRMESGESFVRSEVHNKFEIACWTNL